MNLPNGNDSQRYLRPPDLQPAARFFWALLLTFCALGIALVLPYHETNPVFATFIVAVAAAGWLGGISAGLFASVVSVIAALYFLIPPQFSFALNHPGQLVRLLNVAAICVITAFVVGWLRRALQRNAKLLSQDKARIHELHAASGCAAAESAQLQAVLHGMSEGVVIADAKANVIYYNPAALELYGYQSVKEVQRPLEEFVPIFRIYDLKGNLLPMEQWPLSRTLRGEIVRDYEVRVHRIDNDRSFIGSYNGRQIRDAAGKLTAVLVTIRNITAQKQAEEALRQSAERLRFHVENTPLAVIEWGPDFRLSHWSEGAERMFGWSAEEVLGKAMDEFRWIHEEDMQKVARVAAGLIDGTGPRSVSYNRNYRKNGSVAHCEWYNSSLRDGSGKLASILSLVLDVTERKEAEQLLRESEQRFRALANSIPNIAWSTDVTGHVDFLNDWWYQYTGLKPEESLGRGKILRAMHPDDVERAKSSWRVAVEQGTVYEVECRFRRGSDGMYRWHLDRGVPVRDAEGKIKRWFGTGTDIEDFKRAQEALVRSEKLASTGRMAATIAHEINNPLAAAMNAVYLVRMEENLAPHLGELLTTVDEELRRAAQITRQTLGFYRENGKAEAVMVQDVVESVLQLYGKRISNKGVTVSREYRPTPLVLTSTGELRQVIANLVANAVDASSPGSKLRVRTGLVSGFVTITVADTGCGISRESRARLFEPFFTTKNALGTGLGLWVSQELVKKHGGSIRVHSQAGRGTVFTVYLPISTSQVARAG
jgi:PAS domain S-box-containing protein